MTEIFVTCSRSRKPFLRPHSALFELGFDRSSVRRPCSRSLAIGLWMAMFVIFASAGATRARRYALACHEMKGIWLCDGSDRRFSAHGRWELDRCPACAAEQCWDLVAAWTVARGAFFLPSTSALIVTALADTVFALGLLLAVAWPIVRVRR